MDKFTKRIKVACFTWMALGALALLCVCVAESAGWHAPTVGTWTSYVLSFLSATAALLPVIVEDNRIAVEDESVVPGTDVADSIADTGVIAMMAVILCWVNDSQGTLAWLAVTGGVFAGAVFFHAIVRHQNKVLDETI